LSARSHADTEKKLLEIPVIDISLNDELHPLMVGMQQTTT
jgi:hypothetical protein